MRLDNLAGRAYSQWAIGPERLHTLQSLFGIRSLVREEYWTYKPALNRMLRMPNKRPLKLKLSDQLRRAIDESGMTRYALAKLADIDESALAKFYNARRTLSMPAMDRLGEVLELEIIMRRKPIKKEK